jgi:hypothetical protein
LSGLAGIQAPTQAETIRRRPARALEYSVGAAAVEKAMAALILTEQVERLPNSD